MKYFLLFLMMAIGQWEVSAQETTTPQVTYTPYELMSSYYANQFHPFQKRNIYTGLAFTLTDRKQTNVDQLVQIVIDGDRSDFKLQLGGGYFTGDYGMVGVSFEYIEEKFNGTVYRSPDTLESNSITRGYLITPNFRSIVPLTSNQRLSFFTEVGISAGVNKTLTRNIKDLDVITRYREDEFNFRMGISPGVTFFAIENFAFEVQLDVLGYELSIKETTGNNTDESRDVRQNVNFNINLLSLRLGIAYYFGAGKKRV